MSVDPRLIDVVLRDPSGYDAKMQAGDTRDVLMQACGSATRKFPKEWYIEPKYWKQKAEYLDEINGWALNFIDRFTVQTPTHECTTHSLAANATAARNKARGIIYPRGPEKGFRYPESSKGSVFLSPLSVYAEANPSRWGGANVRAVLEIACRRGILPDTIQPHDYGFQHALRGTSGKGNNNQSGGDWIRLQDFPSGWELTARHFMPQEVIFPESFEEAMCCLLNGGAVSVGRDGHAVPWAKWDWKQDLFPYPDSYDLIRYDSRRRAESAWRGSFCIVTMTHTEDWMKPGALSHALSA